MSPDFNLCTLFFSTRDGVVCPPDPGQEICTKFAKSIDGVEYESDVLKIDSDGTIWRHQSSSWTIDSDYSGQVFTPVVGQSYTGAIVFDTLNAGQCLSSFNPGTNDRIFEVEEFCASTEPPSPYGILSNKACCEY